MKLKCVAAVIVLGAGLAFLHATWRAIGAPRDPPGGPLLVNDVSQLNPVRVARVITPTTTSEIVEAVRQSPGPISIGGARHSMGAQIAAEGGLHIDMRRFNRIISFSPAARTITAQAGATWREIQETIDPVNLSVAIMQSYSNFTVGGSLSVNAHGRYVGVGPIIGSVQSLTLVTADGSVLTASPTEHSDVFYGAIGGYGGLGVIVEATLRLADNVALKRQTAVIPTNDYLRYFKAEVRHRPDVIFHNANLFTDDFSSLRVVTFARTGEPVTVRDRVIPEGQSYRLHRLAFWVASEWPFGKTILREVLDPVYFAGSEVVWRNYEASYDVAQLEPSSRDTSTYVLQEYFLPIDRFDEFVPRTREVLEQHGVNVLNVSVRHATADPGSLLAWARTEVFAFVVYYKQATTPQARREVGVWTRELIDSALDLGGSYYLPYQLPATETQFHRAYPRADEYFALKRRLDPRDKFRNALLDRYAPWHAQVGQ